MHVDSYILLGGIMDLWDVRVYGWLNEAVDDLLPAKNRTALAAEMIPFTGQAKAFSILPYEMADPPYKGYVFQSEKSLSVLEHITNRFR